MSHPCTHTYTYFNVVSRTIMRWFGCIVEKNELFSSCGHKIMIKLWILKKADKHTHKQERRLPHRHTAALSRSQAALPFQLTGLKMFYVEISFQPQCAACHYTHSHTLGASSLSRRRIPLSLFGFSFCGFCLGTDVFLTSRRYSLQRSGKAHCV